MNKLWQIYLLAFFCNEEVGCEIKIALPPDTSVDKHLLHVEKAGVIQEEGGLRIGFGEMGGRWDLLRVLKNISNELTRLPDGCTLEMAFSSDDVEEEAGRHRFLGKVKKGMWTIEDTCPAGSRNILEEAFSILRAHEGQPYLEAKDESELIRLQSQFKEDDLLMDIEIKYDGLKIFPEEPEYNIQLVGQKIFHLRYENIWPILVDDI